MTLYEERARVFRDNLQSLLGPRYSPRSRQALATHLGIPLYTLSRMLSGKPTLPPADRRAAIAAFFRLRPDDLFDPALPNRVPPQQSTDELRQEVIAAVESLSVKDAQRTLHQILDLVRGTGLSAALLEQRPATTRRARGGRPTPASRALIASL